MNRKRRKHRVGSRVGPPPPAAAAPRWDWRRIWLAGVTAVMVATPMIPSDSATEMGTSVVLSMLWLILLLGWALTQATGAGAGATIRWGGTSLAMAVLLACHLLSGSVMAWQGQPRVVVNSVWQWIAFGVTFFLVRQVFRGKDECRAVVAVMMAMAVFLSIYGYHQYAVTMPETRRIWESDPAAALASAGINATPDSPEWALFRSRLLSLEPFATFRLANSLAGFLSPWILIAAAILLSRAERARRHWQVLLAGSLTVLLIAGCWLLTKSRTAWLATAAGAALLVIGGQAGAWRPSRRMVAVGLAALLLLVAGTTLVGGLDKLVVTDADKSMGYRLEYWQATMAMIRDYPWLGCGPGNFQQFYSAYKLPMASETVSDPHNFLLEVWATAGTPALLALIGLLACFAWQVIAPSNRGREVERPETEESSDAVWYVYGGGLAGVLLAYPSGLLMGFLLDQQLVWACTVCAALLLVLWHPWVRSGALSPAPLVCAAIALLINLLSAGGISYAGVATSLWLLLAIALNFSAGTRITRLPRPAAFAAVGIAGLAVAAMYTTAYRPVLHAKEKLAEGQRELRARRLAIAEQAFEEAARRDSLASQPWLSLAQVRHEQWLASGADADLAEFIEAADGLIQRNARSFSARQHYAHWWLVGYRATGNADFLERASDWYRQTLDLYPSYNRGYAQLAWARHLAGQDQAAAQAAAQALALDAVNPHVERKLRRYQLPDPGPLGGARTAAQPSGPADRTAEQWMRQLRIFQQETS